MLQIILLILLALGSEHTTFKSAFVELFIDYPVIYRALWKEPNQLEANQLVYIGPLTQNEKAHIMGMDDAFYGNLAGEWLRLKVKLHWQLANRVNTCDECLYRRILLSLYEVLTNFLHNLVVVQHEDQLLVLQI